MFHLRAHICFMSRRTVLGSVELLGPDITKVINKVNGNGGKEGRNTCTRNFALTFM